MKRYQIIIDTNVLVAALRSKQGASYRLLELLKDGDGHLVLVANRHSIFYLLRPYLKDADDDFILELAFSSAADYIITYNTDNFKLSKTFGVDVITPKTFLQKIGEIP